jgi:PAS domain S-box-containing protein
MRSTVQLMDQLKQESDLRQQLETALEASHRANAQLRQALVEQQSMQRDYEQLKRELFDRQQQLEALFTQSLDGFFFMMLEQPIRWDATVDREAMLDYVFSHQHMVRVNAAMLTQYGATEQDLLGLTPNDFFAHDRPVGRQLWQKMFDQGNVHVATQAHRLDGTPIWIDGDYICLYNQTGEIIGHFGIQRDITDRHQLELERQQTAADLKQSEQKFRAVFDHMFQLIGILSPHGAVIEANQTALDAIGISLSDVVGQPFWNTPWWTHSPQLQRQLKDATVRAAAGELVRFEAEHILVDGTSIFVDFSMKPVLDEIGKVVALIPEGRDISDRKQVETQLREQEAFLKSIYDGTEQAIFVVNVGLAGELRYASFNPVSERYAKITQAEIQDRTPTEAFGADLGFVLQQNYERCLQAGTSITYEEQLDFASHRIWTLTTLVPLRNERDRIYRIIGTATDITDRKRQEEILQNIALGVSAKTGNAFFQALVEYLSKALGMEFGFICELITPECQSIRTIAGYGDGQALANDQYGIRGTPCEQVVVVGQQLCTYPQQIQQHFPQDSYLEDIQAESYMGLPLIDSNGQILGLISVLSRQPIQDPDFMAHILQIFAARAAAELERQQAEAELQRQKADLARSNTELQQFAYIASHDLQEPLRMVTSYLELLERRYKGQLDPKADQFINYAVDGAVRMQTLINALLTYSRVGTTVQSYESIDCAVVLQDVLTNLQVTIAKNRAIITHDPLPEVQGDRTQLIQLFQNLISNGIKFRREDTPHIHIGVKRLADKWLFSIHDNGIGIEAQYTDRIFIIFQRLHSRAAHPGTGIGLSICKKIVERHGGNLWVESQPEQGSVFYFTLPLMPQITAEIGHNL